MIDLDPSKFPLRLEGDCTEKKLLPIVARVTERISTIPTIEVDFFCENGKLALEEIVGKTMHLVAESDDKSKKRWFRGTCVSAEFVERFTVGGHYKAVVRPWLWFLTRRTDLRIFQEMNVVDIIQAVLGEHNFSGHLKLKLGKSYDNRTYCVQYRETDFDFISRLMEEEGIYYHFEHDPETEEMVLSDGLQDALSVPEPSSLMYNPTRMRSTIEITDPLVFDWMGSEQVRSGKVSLEDYDFENSTSSMKALSTVAAGTYSKAADVRYDYPGRYRSSSLGEHYAKVRMEAEAIQHHIVNGTSDAVHLAVGRTFSVTKLERTKDPANVLLVACKHDFVQLEAIADGYFEKAGEVLETAGIGDMHEPHRVRFEAVDKTKQYRAPIVTSWPNVGGIHTAVVTGPPGEEIYTDKYGRIKVQFHWDQDGNKDDNTTCWVRTMMPWTGKNWGAIAVPRIGQEVVIDFEEGDPDRPLCVGMLYNDRTMPPYKLPDNKTQSGVKTNSSPGGGGFNELMFEDKAGDELVRFQSEKNYEEIVKNNATVEIGVQKKDPGDLTLTVENDYTKTINSGDETTIVQSGDKTVDVQSGKIVMTAARSIELTVGSSTIFMDPYSISITSPTITVEGTGKVDVTSPLTTVNADGLLTLTGNLVAIN
ncbi:type VI secretion system Vgr family protein [Marivita hallyeonensis]|uniref:type VI secretion system Vgr family protein n=1 Tax=Marivita hallyeonensis TaxID=996342 RepID=UPI001C4A3810|nr:type VI secretion system tip protein TssI/VgrG [Marivita hallyeonensis]